MQDRIPSERLLPFPPGIPQADQTSIQGGQQPLEKPQSIKAQIANGLVRALATTTFEVTSILISRHNAAALSRTTMLAPFMGQRVKPRELFDSIKAQAQTAKDNVTDRLLAQRRGSRSDLRATDGLSPALNAQVALSQAHTERTAELRSIKKVLTECKEKGKKPQISKDGSLKAVDVTSTSMATSDIATSPKTVAALRSMLQTIHESALLGFPPPKGSGGARGSYQELLNSLLELPHAKALMDHDPSFADLAMHVGDAVNTADRAGTATTTTSKEHILNNILDGNQETSLLMIQSHRNNSRTAGLMGDLLTQVKSQDPPDRTQLHNLVNFANNYLERGDSVPLGGKARDELHQQMANLTTLAEENGVPVPDNIRTFTPARPEATRPASSESVQLSMEHMEAYELSNHASALLEQRFLEIHPSELDGLAWSKPGIREEQAPHIIAYTAAFNKIAEFAAHQIVFADNPAKATMKVVKAAELALENGNPGAAFALYSALQNNGVARMNRTISEKLSDKQKARIETLKQNLSPAKNNQVFRAGTDTALSEGRPITPYLGVYLTDLTFIEPNPSGPENEPDSVNLGKNQMSAEVKEQVRTLQQNVRSAQGRPQVDPTFAEGLTQFSTNDDAIYARSLEIEPKIAR